ncbi:hypothetical protein RB628_03610 [Streptomyces sp. ADMS]|uniref:hypothetical protein n=1 Tax=Streptomyces sp. ADMS TaxID=3071415 RepID=UPI00296FDD77|nr:hypothetical protein [Streptomyces sp. ADMS]MDW4904447.1 hypothetical protein [Streptomyces sp. ADMS]
MTRDQALTEARHAVGRAKELATYAESAAHSFDNRAKAPTFAAAGALWADVARSYATLAQAMPETETTNV